MDFLNKIAGEGAPSPEEAEVKLDLSDMEKDDALKMLNKTLNECKRSKTTSLYVCFNPATASSGETLFQPVMRTLKVEKWNDYINHASPLLTSDKGGVFVVFKS